MEILNNVIDLQSVLLTVVLCFKIYTIGFMVTLVIASFAVGFSGNEVSKKQIVYSSLWPMTISAEIGALIHLCFLLVPKIFSNVINKYKLHIKTREYRKALAKAKLQKIKK